MIIKLVTLTRSSRKSDRSATISFNTRQEQTGQEMTELDALFQHDCIIAIKKGDAPFKDEEIKGLEDIDVRIYDNKKSQSKLMRESMWRAQREILNRNPTEDEFNEYYKTETNTIIRHYNNKTI